MTSLKYRVDSGSESSERQSHEGSAEALLAEAEAIASIEEQEPTAPPNRDLDQWQAERLIGNVEAAGSAPDEPGSETGSTAVNDPDCTSPAAEDRSSSGAYADRPGSGREAPPALAKPADEQPWILPSILVVLTIGLAIFFLVHFSEVGDYPPGVEGADVSDRASRAEWALDSSTRSKLAELNRRVIFWMSRNADGFDPRKVSLKRVREELDLSSDQMLDSWGRPIRYEVAAGRYALRSSGPDKTFNTGDDLVEPQPQFPSPIGPVKP